MTVDSVMAAELLGFSYDAWTLTIAAAGLVVVAVGTLIALRQLSAVAIQSRFAGAVEFQRLTREHEVRVQWVLDNFPVVTDHAELDALPADVSSQARLVVNALNDTGQLLEAGLISKRIYFGLYYTQVIRLVFLLRPFLAWEESRIGGRYGRRLIRLDARARRYHDIRGIHRRTVIKLARQPTSIDVYKTDPARGLGGLVRRTVWGVRWLSQTY